MSPMTEDDIRRAVPPNAVTAGRAYERSGRVLDLQLLAGGRVIETAVRGSARRPYRVHITIGARLSDKSPLVSGSCSCPVGHNCKHVAASLFAAMKRDGAPTPPPTAREAQAPRGIAAEPPLSSALAAWLESLERVRQDETEDYPPSVRKRLLYIASVPRTTGGSGRLGMELVGIEIRRDGTPAMATMRRHAAYQFHSGQLPRFLRPSDRAILRLLGSIGYNLPDGGTTAVAAVREIIATGRGRWDRADGPALRLGEARPGRLAWRMDAEGAQRPALEADGETLAVFAGAPWYIEPATGTMGALEVGVPPAVVRAVLAAPTVPPEAAERLGAQIARRLHGIVLPPPHLLGPVRTVGGTPIPCLELFGVAKLDGIPAGRLSFRYEAVPVPAFPRGADLRLRHEGQLCRVTRDTVAERDAEMHLDSLGLSRVSEPPWGFPAECRDCLLLDDDPAAWIDFLLDDLPALRDSGWQVDVAESFPVRLAQIQGDISAEIHEGSGTDWFDLALGVMVDGERVDLIPALLGLIADSRALSALFDDGAALDDAAPLLLRLADGRLLPVPGERIRPILAPLLELFAGGVGPDGGIRLSRANAADLALLEEAGAGVVWAGGEAVRSLGRQLRDAGGIPRAAVPESFVGELRPYQARGVDWLQFLRTAGLGGVLADDMGLGKTVQALAHLAIEQAEGRLDCPALVVCPTSLVPNWRAEAARFAPSLRVLTLHGPDRAARFAEIGAHDLVLTTYPLLARDHAALAAQEWHVVALDEAQVIKNPAATTSKLARTLKARQRLCLSGTPLENHLGELWSLFDFLTPGFLGDRRNFQRRFRAPIEKDGDMERQAVLAKRVAPFLLRRTKAEVAADLPPKTEITETIEMGDGQRAIYESIRLAMHAKVRQAIAERGLARSGIIVLDALLKLRQACCDPRLLKLATARAARARSAKLARLMELLPEMIEEGRRVLLFSQFTSMLALIEAELAEMRLPYVLLTGDTRDRKGPVGRFQAGEVPLFLISLKAGGVGLNLTAADTVIHYDPWWNPAVEDQATDRAHRIGQDKAVFVHRLITQDTIEEKMEALKARKEALAAGILGAEPGKALAMSEDDVEALLAPGMV